MSSTVKIILGLLAGLVLVCLCAAAVSFLLIPSIGRTITGVFQTGPADVAKVSASIADYTLPTGFGDATATDLAGFSFVSYTGDDNHSHIMFFQLPAGVHVDQASLEQQFQQAAGRNAKDWNKTEVVDQLPCSINGQDVMLTITEGVNHDGQTFRQATAMFQGKGGQAMVAYETPVSSWDQARVDEFLASIH